jgi:TPR repeat protein
MKGFENHADRGLADAQELYGFLLLHKGIDDSSKSAGARYLMMCVDVSRPKVCWQLHKIFEQGNIMGFPADEKRSSKYLGLAREAGHPLAVDD